MRNLKFRAWDRIKRKMLYGVSPFDVHITDENEPLLSLEYSKHDDCEFEQYTGLKDKNGKEIYEGDILGGIWESGFISWCEKCKQFQYHSAGIGCMACSGDVHWYEIVEDDGKLEVIGNIHENHELLEEQ